jgi:hypothetical protein
LASGVCSPEADPLAEAPVVVGPEPALGTVGDCEPVEQAATLTTNTTVATAHSCDERIIPPCDKPRRRTSFLGDRYALAGINDVCGF